MSLDDMAGNGIPESGDGLADLLSRAAIADLVHTYSWYVRDGRAGECGALFTEEATYEVRDANGADPRDEGRLKRDLRGRQAISDFLAGTARSGIRLCPFIHNLLIDVQGDRATGHCIMESRTWPAGNESVGEYRDRFRRVDGAWLFESRVYLRFEAVPATHVG